MRRRLIALPAADVARLLLGATAGATHDTDTASQLQLSTSQQTGAADALRILRALGGVLVADDVGLGKTFIALRLIERCAPQHAVVTIPAPLRAQWRRALARIGRSDVELVSHTKLRSWQPRQRLDVVVVDEAHAFRNPRTARYRALARLCVGARVVLLTATPINNRGDDLYWLLRLFLGDGSLARHGVADLRSALCGDEPDAVLARRVIRNVGVRRTRVRGADESIPGTVGGFPRRAQFTTVVYDVDAGDPDFLDDAITLLDTLALAPFGHDHASALVRLGLLKRLESSRTAFLGSLHRLRTYLDHCRAAARDGTFLRPRAMPARSDQLLIPLLLAEATPPSVDLQRLARSIDDDLHRLERFLARRSHGVEPKLDRLVELLTRDFAGQRVVVFTEFADTADVVFERLCRRFAAALITGRRCAIASGPAPRRFVLERFAPRAQGATEPAPHERIDVLVATDVLGEGLDLQDASCAVSYDLPWNPVRLLQRIGRIDRLGSPHRQIHPVVFVPGTRLDTLLRLGARLTTKLRLQVVTIDGGVGRGVDIDFIRALGDGGEVFDISAAADDAAEPDPLEHLRQRHGVRGGAADRHLPVACLVIDGSAVDARLPVLITAWRPTAEPSPGNDTRERPGGWLSATGPDGPVDEGVIATLLERALHVDRPGRCDPACVSAALRSAAHPRGRPSSAIAGRCVRLVRRLMADRRIAADPTLGRRIDRILRLLRRDLSVGEELSLGEAVDRCAGLSPAAAIQTLEAALADAATADRAPARNRLRFRLAGALLVVPGGAADGIDPPSGHD